MSATTDPSVLGRFAEPLALVRAGLAGLRAVPVWQASERELLAVVRDLYALDGEVAAVRLGVLAEVDARGAARATGARTTASWLRAAARREARLATRDVKLARALNTDRAHTGAALADGRISTQAAGIVVAAITNLPASLPAETVAEAEVALVGFAQCMDEHDLRLAVRRLDYVLDPDGVRALAREERRLRAKRELHLVPDPDGCWHLAGQLDAASGELLRSVLDPLSAPRPAAADGPDRRSPAQRRADALVDLARIAATSGLMPSQGGAPVTVLLTVDEQALRHDAEQAGILPSGQLVSPGELRRIACDTAILPAVMNGPSMPLDLGRTAYTVPPHLRKALILRDKGCAFPACTAPWQWADAHHIVYWRHGGATALDNLVLLCGHHHRVIHDPDTGWTITANPGAPPTFTPPAFTPPAWNQPLAS